jgi:hypothetical protein
MQIGLFGVLLAALGINVGIDATGPGIALRGALAQAQSETLHQPGRAMDTRSLRGGQETLGRA